MSTIITTIEDAVQVITEVLEGNDIEAAVNVAKDVAGIFGLKDTSTQSVQAQLPAAVESASPTEREQLLQQAMALQSQQTQLDESILNQG